MQSARSLGLSHFGAAALSLCLMFTLLGCSSEVMDNDSPPEKQYAEGERLLKKDRYLEAVERFRILKSRFPYSKYAALATLRIGDSHFQEESFIEAASAYKVFRELYPKHEQAAYALARIAESHYNLVPSTIDRDLDAAHSSIAAYTQLATEYPSAPQQADAQKRVKELKGKLADKENYIAQFYYKRELYQAAAGRYAHLVDTYPDQGFNRESLYRLAFSYERMGEFRKSADTLDRLDSEFPDGKGSAERMNLRKLLSAAEKAE